jgi:UDP-N-acetylglucosamine 2-epimerase (non-hydrolysing)
MKPSHSMWRSIFIPFPEEINHHLTTFLSDIHFAQTLSARQALLNEGVAAKKIIITGNTVVDSLIYISQSPFSFDGSELKKP